MPVATAISAAYSSGALKSLKNTGEKILGKLTGCRVKPKGTPHVEVWKRAPKYFFTYGSGIPGSGEFKVSSKTNGGVFDTVSGQWVTNMDAIFPVADRKAIEATLRKECESVTGDASFYVEVRTTPQDMGLVRLRDGKIYAAEIYSVAGGTYTNPVSLDIDPKGLVSETGTATASRQPVQAGGIGLALGALFLLGKMGKRGKRG